MSAEAATCWRLLDTGLGDACTNMAVDEAMLEACAAGAASPTLRFYGWSPPAISIGFGQQLGSAIDLDRCHALGIEVVRRPTGGLAVLHDQEVTYSVVVREDDPRIASGILAAYLTISRALVRGLSYLDVKADLLPLRRSSLPSDSESPVCFLTPSSYEVAVQGRKLVGSAQRRVQGVILQHGSLPISLDLDTLFSVLPLVRRNGPSAAAESEAPLRMTSLQEAGGRPYAYAEVVAALSRGFAEVWGARLISGGLTPEEQQASTRLRLSKYGADSWLWRR
jgi:lipoate-protein ligase A